MQFCKECENKLFPFEEDDILWNKCMNCGFKEEYVGSIIEKKNYKILDTLSAEKNKYLIFDPTFPRTKFKECPNNECISHKDKNLQEVIMVQDSVTIKMTYICVNCNAEWKYT